MQKLLLLLVFISNISIAQVSNAEKKSNRCAIQYSFSQSPFMEGNQIRDRTINSRNFLGLEVLVKSFSENSYLYIVAGGGYQNGNFVYKPLVTTSQFEESIDLSYKLLSFDIGAELQYDISEEKNSFYVGIEAGLLSIPINRKLSVNKTMYVDPKHIFVDDFFSAFRPEISCEIGKRFTLFNIELKTAIELGLMINIGKSVNYLGISIPNMYFSNPENTAVYEKSFYSSLSLSIPL